MTAPDDQQIHYLDFKPSCDGIKPCTDTADFYIEYHPVGRHPDGCDGQNLIKLVCLDCLETYEQAAALTVHAMTHPWWSILIPTPPPKCLCGMPVQCCSDVLQVVRKI